MTGQRCPLDYNDITHRLDAWLGTQTEIYVLPASAGPPPDTEDPAGWVCGGPRVEIFGILRRADMVQRMYRERVGAYPASHRFAYEPLEVTERRSRAYTFVGLEIDIAEYFCLRVEPNVRGVEHEYGYLWFADPQDGLAYAVLGGLQRPTHAGPKSGRRGSETGGADHEPLPPQ